MFPSLHCQERARSGANGGTENAGELEPIARNFKMFEPRTDAHDACLLVPFGGCNIFIEDVVDDHPEQVTYYIASPRITASFLVSFEFFVALNAAKLSSMALVSASLSAKSDLASSASIICAALPRSRTASFCR